MLDKVLRYVIVVKLINVCLSYRYRNLVIETARWLSYLNRMNL